MKTCKVGCAATLKGHTTIITPKILHRVITIQSVECRCINIIVPDVYITIQQYKSKIKHITSMKQHCSWGKNNTETLSHLRSKEFQKIYKPSTRMRLNVCALKCIPENWLHFNRPSHYHQSNDCPHVKHCTLFLLYIKT